MTDQEARKKFFEYFVSIGVMEDRVIQRQAGLYAAKCPPDVVSKYELDTPYKRAYAVLSAIQSKGQKPPYMDPLKNTSEDVQAMVKQALADYAKEEGRSVGEAVSRLVEVAPAHFRSIGLPKPYIAYNALQIMSGSSLALTMSDGVPVIYDSNFFIIDDNNTKIYKLRVKYVNHEDVVSLPQPIGLANTTGLFSYTVFRGPVSFDNWDLSNVTCTDGMFERTNFKCDVDFSKILSNTKSVISSKYMFFETRFHGNVTFGQFDLCGDTSDIFKGAAFGGSVDFDNMSPTMRKLVTDAYNAPDQYLAS